MDDDDEDDEEDNEEDDDDDNDEEDDEEDDNEYNDEDDGDKNDEDDEEDDNEYDDEDDDDDKNDENEPVLDEKSGLCVSPDNMAGNATRHRDTPNWEGHIIYIDIYIYINLDYIYLCNQTPPTEKARWGSILQSDFIFQLRWYPSFLKS